MNIRKNFQTVLHVIRKKFSKEKNKLEFGDINNRTVVLNINNTEVNTVKDLVEEVIEPNVEEVDIDITEKIEEYKVLNEYFMKNLTEYMFIRDEKGFKFNTDYIFIEKDIKSEEDLHEEPIYSTISDVSQLISGFLASSEYVANKNIYLYLDEEVGTYKILTKKGYFELNKDKKLKIKPYLTDKEIIFAQNVLGINAKENSEESMEILDDSKNVISLKEISKMKNVLLNNEVSKDLDEELQFLNKFIIQKEKL